ncbi:MAG TPA: ATPase [Clostridiales bacterium]|jgi:V/A-type H+-transporting ATPase subunit K|nr:ATPase [Clostridiales bacterium]HBR07692.1 ATPase [Clostridiales bacterium]
MLKLIYPAIVMLILIVLPLAAIYRRAKRGKSVKKPLYANLCLFFTMFAVSAAVFLSQGVAAAGDTMAAGGTDWTTAVAYISAALAVGISGLASAKAVAQTACAAIGAMVENEGTFGKSLVFVGMAEGIAIYGLLIGIVIVLF